MKHICKSCGKEWPSWSGKCSCGEWNTIVEKRIPTQKEFDDWYDDRIAEARTADMKCLECGCNLRSDLNSGEIWIQRRVIAHVLPKGTMPSVGDNPINWMPLCWQHHSDYDSSWDKAKTMKVWPIASGIIERLRPFVIEKKYLP